MNRTHEAGSETQRLTQFQLQGDAAERYERWAVPFVVGPWAPGLLDLAEVRRGERVLDIATGTGVVARLAARRVVPGGTVTGVDLNERMLEVARRLPLPPGLTIDWRQGRALALPFADGERGISTWSRKSPHSSEPVEHLPGGGSRETV